MMISFSCLWGFVVCFVNFISEIFYNVTPHPSQNFYYSCLRNVAERSPNNYFISL